MSMSRYALLCSVLASIVQGQSPGHLRLVNSTSNFAAASGRLEIYLSGQWGTVCSVGFGPDDATLACNQLGYRTYSNYGRVGTLGHPSAPSATPIWISNLSCDVSEHLTIFQCPRTTGSLCTHSQDIALECSSPYSTRTFSDRLVSRNEKTSSNLTAGRLEFFFSGKWGSVCSDGFTSTDASVFCDVTTGSTTVLRYGPVGSNGLEFDPAPSSSPIWLQNLDCRLNSTARTYFCSHDGLGVADCQRDKVAAISCLANGAVRLVTSSSPSTTNPGGDSGRLEFYNSGEWGTVCDDGFGQTEADVVCRQLGYNRASRYGSVGDLGYSRGSGTIWRTNADCTSSSATLVGCGSLRSTFLCSHSEDVAITCTQSPLSASGLTAAAIAGIVVGALAVACCCFCICLIATIYYCNQSGKSHTTTRTPRTTNVASSTNSTGPAYASAPPQAAVVMTAINTEAYMYSPQQEPPPPFYPQAQTHTGEAPPNYNTAYYYPKAGAFY